YTPHRNTKFKKACKLLNIILVHLPPYSPQLNPIEQVWKSIKRITYTTFVETKEELIKLFKKEYYKIINNKSFFNKWVSKYILKSKVFNYKLRTMGLGLSEKYFLDIIISLAMLKCLMKP
ncbi:DDE superfamily endonuclease, partial [Methanobrevibacter gottschalkii DSM 11977]